jgi:predicted secreted protein
MCTDDFSGTYRFATSHGNRYVVLYKDGDKWYSLAYQQTTDVLSLRYANTTSWFDLNKTFDATMLSEADNGGTYPVTEGSDVVVKLDASPSTGYKWEVKSTDRTFGYPTETFTQTDFATGGGGTSIFSWRTTGYLSEIGEHHVTLEYRRPWETSTPAIKVFELTVDVQKAP